MNRSLEDSLYDLIRNRFSDLNELLENFWLSYSNKPLSLSEWNIISHISEEKLFISEVAKLIPISRQATHKLIKQLEVKGVVEIFQTEQNKRDKCVRLTPYGKQCYEKYVELKEELEQRISEKIGKENVQILKKLLKNDWGI